VSHQYAAGAAAFAGLGLVLASQTATARLAMLVYALALVGLFTVSALYHRITWSAESRRRLRRLDHAMIFVLIAGTYTPFAALVLSPQIGMEVLIVIWIAALTGVVMQLAWHSGPRWLMAAQCVAIGWIALVALPDLYRAAGAVPVALLVGGGALYTLGALAYVRQRPNPVPAIFGYHEVFHALVVGAALLHFVAIAGWALPRA
jgi:hemolysin III